MCLKWQGWVSEEICARQGSGGVGCCLVPGGQAALGQLSFYTGECSGSGPASLGWRGKCYAAKPPVTGEQALAKQVPAMNLWLGEIATTKRVHCRYQVTWTKPSKRCRAFEFLNTSCRKLILCRWSQRNLFPNVFKFQKCHIQFSATEVFPILMLYLGQCCILLSAIKKHIPFQQEV